MKKSTNLVFILLSLLLFGGFVYWKLSANTKVMAQKMAIGSQKTMILPVTVVNASIEIANTSQNYNGVFIPAQSLNLQSDIAGRIISNKLTLGNFVKKGQILLQVANEDIEVENEQNRIDKILASQSLIKAKADLQKYEAMLQNDAATKQQVDDQKLFVQEAESRLNSLHKKSRSTTILAPMTGIVNKSYVLNGSYISPGSNLAEILDNNQLKMQINVPDAVVFTLAVGQTINIIPDLFPGQTIKGKINYISAQADASRNFAVEILFANKTKNLLKAGMTAKAVLGTKSQKKSLALPINCLVGSVQNPQIYLVKNGEVILTKIKVGAMFNDKIAVLSGLTEADVVVATGRLNLVNGAKVQIINL
jgi:membrane fusion protein, multidrug efflux system